MSQHEHPALQNMHSEGIPTGEVTELTGSGITIAGTFSPGTAVTLHPGARAFVLTEDDVIAMTKY